MGSVVDSRRKLKEKKGRKKVGEDVDSLRKLKEKINGKKRKEEDAEMGNPLSADTDGNFSKALAKKKNKKRSDDISNTVDAKVLGLSSIKANGTPEANDGNKCKRNYRIKLRKRVKADEEIAVNTKLESEDHDTNSTGLDEADTKSFNSSGKSKMSAKQKKKRTLLGKESSQDDSMEKKGSVADDEVVQMSSGDEDFSKGMKNWVMQYHQSRPGIKVLQERIDDFITEHEAQEKQARMQREAQLEEGGWTVVVHHKGRKKTTDAESGTAVGSVAQAAVLDKMAKKKSTDIGLDFYRFQRREAHKNEVLMLQSKFEQDKKRIQEMRAARKFRPY